MVSYLTLQSAAEKLNMPVSDILQLAEEGKIQIFHWLDTEKEAKRFSKETEDHGTWVGRVERRACDPGYYPLVRPAVPRSSEDDLESLGPEVLSLDAGEGYRIGRAHHRVFSKNDLKIHINDVRRVKRSLLSGRGLRVRLSIANSGKGSHWTHKARRIQKAIKQFLETTTISDSRLYRADGRINIAKVARFVCKDRLRLGLPVAKERGYSFESIRHGIREMNKSLKACE